jgi:hypothetical protein
MTTMMMMMPVTPEAAGHLDSSGNGALTTMVKPTSSVEGPQSTKKGWRRRSYGPTSCSSIFYDDAL